MAGRGPTPKPNSQRKRKAVTVPKARKPKPPEPGVEWSAAVVKGWRDFWTSPLATLVHDSDLPAVRRMFQLRHDRDACYEIINKVGHLTKGSQGQIVLNPVLRQVNAYDVEIRNLEDRFGLSPRARLSLGVKEAPASTPAARNAKNPYVHLRAVN